MTKIMKAKASKYDECNYCGENVDKGDEVLKYRLADQVYYVCTEACYTKNHAKHAADEDEIRADYEYLCSTD